MKQLAACALLLALMLARPATAQTRRTLYGLQLWPELQAELALPNRSYLLVALRGQNATDNNASNDPDRVLGFDVRRATLGYEYFMAEHWSIGGTLNYASANKNYVVVPEVLLRHRSPLGPLTFGQRLGLERTYPGPTTTANQPAPPNQTFLRLRFDLEKLLPLGGGSFTLRPRLSYEAVSRVRLLKSNTDEAERLVQFASLRAEVGCRVADHFDITPWVAYQTNYLITLPQYDAMGNQTSGGNLNIVTPVVGLEARYSFFKSKPEAETQLPTQH